MTQETQVTGTDPAALPEIIQQPDEEAPAETAVTEPEPEGEAAAEAPAEVVKFDAERYKEDDSYKEHIDTVAKTAKRDGHLAALEQFQQSDTQQARVLGQINAGIREFNKLWKDAGLDPEAAATILEQHAPQLNAFKNWNDQMANETRNQGFVNAIAFTMQKFSEEPDVADPTFGQKYAERFVKEIPYDGGVEAMQDWMKDTRKKIREKIAAPYEKQIADLKAQIAGGKVASRQNGPDTAQKGGGRGRPDSEVLMDPNTPIHVLQEIRDRQKAG